MLNGLKSKIKTLRLKTAQQIALGFLALILLGAFFLCLPISSANGEWGSFFDSLFTSVGAVCVTGLMGAPIEQMSVFGKVLILVLAQIGALGLMTLTTLIMIIMRKKIRLKDRVALQNALNTDSTKGIVKLVKNILILTFSIEFLGFIALLPSFCISYGAIGIWYAFFYAVSAFCNVGLALPQAPLNNYSLAVMAVLIILGGLGFIVIMDVIRHKGRFKRFSLHSKIVLPMTLALLIIGWAGFFAFEYNNPFTLKGKSLFSKLLLSFFESANCRTAGFSVLDHTSLNEGTKLIRDILVFIGGSPGSMAGGIKTTTAAVLVLTVFSALKDKSSVTVSRHNLNQKIILKSVAIFGLGIICIIGLMLFLLVSEGGNKALTLSGGNEVASIFHICVSTFSTAGYYGEQINLMSAAGKCALMAAMLIGRIGLTTTGLIFASTRPQPIIKYPDGNITLG